MSTAPSSTKDRLVVQHGDWFAVWHGGAYIEVFHRNGPHALDVINVWDYSAGEPTISWNRRVVRRRLVDWVAESGPDFVREYGFELS